MSPVSIAREGDVSVITVDNPPVNALSQAVRQGLVECIDEILLQFDKSIEQHNAFKVIASG